MRLKDEYIGIIEVNLREAIDRVLSESVEDTDGQLEVMTNKFEKLVDIVGSILGKMPEERVTDILIENSYRLRRVTTCDI